MVTTGLGKSIVKSLISEDAILVIELLARVLTTLHPNDTTVAFNFEQTVLKTAVDVVFLIQDKVISKETVLMTRDPLFRLWYVLFVRGWLTLFAIMFANLTFCARALGPMFSICLRLALCSMSNGCWTLWSL